MNDAARTAIFSRPRAENPERSGTPPRTVATVYRRPITVAAIETTRTASSRARCACSLV